MALGRRVEIQDEVAQEAEHTMVDKPSGLVIEGPGARVMLMR